MVLSSSVSQSRALPLMVPLSHVSPLVPQNALSSFDFLSKRNSVVMNPDILDQNFQDPELELPVHKPRDVDPEIRSEGFSAAAFLGGGLYNCKGGKVVSSSFLLRSEVMWCRLK